MDQSRHGAFINGFRQLTRNRVPAELAFQVTLLTSGIDVSLKQYFQGPNKPAVFLSTMFADGRAAEQGAN
jgi:hypothetical protein